MHRALRISLRLLVALVGVIVLAWVAAALFLGWADLRPESLRDTTDLAAAEREGRRLLACAADAHGAEAVAGFSTLTVRAVDEWIGESAWWPSPRQRFDHDLLLGTFSSRVELLDGPGAGEVWGIQDWRPYKTLVGETERTFLAEDAPIEFYLPTLQYFHELAFRMPAADVVLAAGSVDRDGESFERVLVSWESAAPHAEHDQYRLELDAECRIAAAVYTVRDAVAISPFLMRPLVKAFGVGTMRYEDYREVQGVAVPYLQTVYLGEPAPGADFMHRLVVESVAFDAVAPAELLPDGARDGGGDRKPSGSS